MKGRALPCGEKTTRSFPAASATILRPSGRARTAYGLDSTDALCGLYFSSTAVTSAAIRALPWPTRSSLPSVFHGGFVGTPASGGA